MYSSSSLLLRMIGKMICHYNTPFISYVKGVGLSKIVFYLINTLHRTKAVLNIRAMILNLKETINLSQLLKMILWIYERTINIISWKKAKPSRFLQKINLNSSSIFIDVNSGKL